MVSSTSSQGGFASSGGGFSSSGGFVKGNSTGFVKDKTKNTSNSNSNTSSTPTKSGGGGGGGGKELKSTITDIKTGIVTQQGDAPATSQSDLNEVRAKQSNNSRELKSTITDIETGKTIQLGDAPPTSSDEIARVRASRSVRNLAEARQYNTDEYNKYISSAERDQKEIQDYQTQQYLNDIQKNPNVDPNRYRQTTVITPINPLFDNEGRQIESIEITGGIDPSIIPKPQVGENMQVRSGGTKTTLVSGENYKSLSTQKKLKEIKTPNFSATDFNLPTPDTTQTRSTILDFQDEPKYKFNLQEITPIDVKNTSLPKNYQTIQNKYNNPNTSTSERFALLNTDIKKDFEELGLSTDLRNPLFSQKALPYVATKIALGATESVTNTIEFLPKLASPVQNLVIPTLELGFNIIDNPKKFAKDTFTVFSTDPLRYTSRTITDYYTGKALFEGGKTAIESLAQKRYDYLIKSSSAERDISTYYDMNTKAFGGTENFPKSKSVAEIKAKFRASGLPEEEGGTGMVFLHASSQPIPLKELEKGVLGYEVIDTVTYPAGTKNKFGVDIGGRAKEDIGMFGSTPPEGSSYFNYLKPLESGQPKAGFNLLPDLEIKRPTLQITRRITEIRDIPRPFLMQLDYEGSNAFLASLNGERPDIIYIPKRSVEAPRSGTAGIFGTTSETQAIKPIKTRYAIQSIADGQAHSGYVVVPNTGQIIQLREDIPYFGKSNTRTIAPTISDTPSFINRLNSYLDSSVRRGGFTKYSLIGGESSGVSLSSINSFGSMSTSKIITDLPRFSSPSVSSDSSDLSFGVFTESFLSGSSSAKEFSLNSSGSLKINSRSSSALSPSPSTSSLSRSSSRVGGSSRISLPSGGSGSGGSSGAGGGNSGGGGSSGGSTGSGSGGGSSSFYRTGYSEGNYSPRGTPKPTGFLPKVSGEKQKLIKGFDVYVKKGKDFLKINSNPLPKLNAFNLGQEQTDNSARASFRLKQSKESVFALSKFNKYPTTQLGKFYSRKNKTGDITFIEKNKFRIDSSGEKFDITSKGLLKLKQKRGILKLW